MFDEALLTLNKSFAFYWDAVLNNEYILDRGYRNSSRFDKSFET